MGNTLHLSAAWIFALMSLAGQASASGNKLEILEQKLLSEAFIGCKAVRASYRNAIFNCEQSYFRRSDGKQLDANGKPFHSDFFSTAQRDESITYLSPTNEYKCADGKANVAYLASLTGFFTVKRKNDGGYLLVDARTRARGRPIADYGPFSECPIKYVTGVYSIWDVPIWEIASQSKHVSISKCERTKTASGKEVVRLSLKSKRQLSNPGGSTESYCDLDPTQGWVVSTFRHPVADKNGVVSAFSHYDYVYEGELAGGVGKLKETIGYGFKPDGVTHGSPVSEIFRVLSFEQRELSDADFRPEAFGVAFAKPKDWAPSTYVIMASVIALFVSVLWYLWTRRQAALKDSQT